MCMRLSWVGHKPVFRPLVERMVVVEGLYCGRSVVGGYDASAHVLPPIEQPLIATLNETVTKPVKIQPFSANCVTIRSRSVQWDMAGAKGLCHAW